MIKEILQKGEENSMRLSDIVIPKSAPATSSKANNKKGICTIAFKPGSCKCIVFDISLAETLGLDDMVKVAFFKNPLGILLGKHIPGIEHEGYRLKERKSRGKASKKVLYNTPLVEEIIERFQLDFSDRTTVTFYGLEIEEIEDSLIAIIRKEGN